MHLKLEDKEHYARPKYGKDRIRKDLGDELSKLQFVVTHYAGQVQYTAHNWLEESWPPQRRPRRRVGIVQLRGARPALLG